jgi:gliding motility-associated protein GldE
MAGFGTMETILLLIVIVLLMLSALISGSEAAFFSLSPADKEALKENEAKGASFVQRLLNKPKDLLATLLIANNFVNVGIVIISSALLAEIYPASPENEVVHVLVEVVGITLVLLLLGEVIPKIYATKNALRFSTMTARYLYYVSKLPPLSWMRMGLVKSTAFIQRRARKGKVKISSDDLEHALALTKDEGQEATDHKILEGIVRFGNTEVRQIMKPRLDVYAMDADSNFSEVMETILDCGHSRIPVYRENFDQIVGVLFIKDLLPFIGQEEVEWLKLVRPPFFVPENKKIDDLLKEFQEKKVHIALVVDEYGGTSGIVTLEDILEEIVGDITDEFDDVEVVYTKINDHTYLFEGKTALLDFLKVIGIDEKDPEFDVPTVETLGGFVVEKAGRILMNNEYVIVGNLKLVVESSDKKRIKMIKAIKTEEKP